MTAHQSPAGRPTGPAPATRRDFLRGAVASWGAGVAAIGRGTAVAPGRDGDAPDLGPGPHLLLDDALIERAEGLARVVHPPERLPRPVLDAARFGVTQPYLAVVSDPHPDRPRVRLWYNRGPAVWHAESDDGLSWHDPRVAWDLDRGYGASVIDDRDREPDPARRFKLANWQATRAREDSPRDDGGLYVATSPDGLRWTPQPGNPALRTWPTAWPTVEPHGVGDTIDTFYDPIRRRYGAAVKVHALPEDGYAPAPKAGRIFRRLVGMTTSDDFVRWGRPWRIFVPDEEDEGLTEFYGMGGVHARGPLLIGFVRVLRDDLPCDPGGPVEGVGYSALATSRDGVRWRRDRVPFLDRNPEAGSWDHAMSWVGGVLPFGEALFLYYGGYARGHKVAPDRERQIGLARMPRDRYASRTAGPTPGTLRTTPFAWPGGTLTVNARTRGGEVRVRLLDAEGRPPAGFDWDDSAPIVRDSPAADLAWPASPSPGRPVRLEFLVRRADLFGFDFRTPRA